MKTPRHRWRLLLTGLMLSMALTVMIGPRGIFAGEPQLRVDTDWRHVPAEQRDVPDRESGLGPGKAGRGHGWWDTLLGAMALGALGTGLFLRGGRGAAVLDYERRQKTGEFLRGFAAGAGRMLKDIVIIGLGMVGAGLFLAWLGVPTAVLLGIAILGMGAAAVMGYLDRSAEVRAAGVQLTLWQKLGLAVTAAFDIVGLPAMIESARGQRLFSNLPLTPAERGEQLGSGLVQVGTFAFAGARAVRLIATGRAPAAFRTLVSRRGPTVPAEPHVAQGMAVHSSRGAPPVARNLMESAPVRSISHSPRGFNITQAEIRARVLANIEASKAARMGSGFGPNSRPFTSAGLSERQVLQVLRELYRGATVEQALGKVGRPDLLDRSGIRAVLRGLKRGFSEEQKPKFSESPEHRLKSAADTVTQEGRIPYSHRFETDLENFVPGTANLHDGPLQHDLLLVQFHQNTPLGNGRSAKWWTPVEQANAVTTLREVLEVLALIPEWGPREAVSVARIPRGTHVTFYRGLAMKKYSGEVSKWFRGGGVQLRFRDFDPSWIVETRELPR